MIAAQISQVERRGLRTLRTDWNVVRLIYRAGLIAALAASPALANADTGFCNQPDQRQVNDCLSRALSDAQATLKRYETAAEEALKASSGRSEAVADLVDASTHWAKYRDSECAAVSDQLSDGTAGLPLYTCCAINITNAHTHEILSNFLKPFGGGSPLLPEPGGSASAP